MAHPIRVGLLVSMAITMMTILFVMGTQMEDVDAVTQEAVTAEASLQVTPLTPIAQAKPTSISVQDPDKGIPANPTFLKAAEVVEGIAARTKPETQSHVSKMGTHTASKGPKLLTWVTIGDWGAPTPPCKRIAQQMGDWAQEHGAKFAISVGDNFYPRGVSSPSDSVWTHNFEDLFSHNGLHIPWHVVLGNHDHKGHAMSQVEYSTRSKRWNMPALFFMHSVQQAGVSMDLFFMDSYGRRPGWEAQIKWLEGKLQGSTAEWKIIVNHKPVYSSGTMHGTNKYNIKTLVPLMDKYNVQLYMNGDDHHLEVLRDSNQITYLVTGSASYLHEVPEPRIPESLWAQATHGFAVHTLHPDTLQTDIISHEGAVLHSISILRNRTYT
mmetsp:Transcript_21493/g.38590  ORF Transcript_21493/g.38590 Transcript_21493/m.38590 type:complete len:381 (-) Transcript_21493:1162-2304(-)